MNSLALRTIVTGIGASVAIVTALSLPAAYFASGYFSLARHLDFKAELNAAQLAKYISTHNTLWQFQHVRIAELLSQNDGADTGFRKRIIDPSNRVILDEGEVLHAPTLSGRHPVTVAGATMATMEVEASLRPLLIRTALIAAFSSMLAFGIFFAIRSNRIARHRVYRVPVRAFE